MARKTSKRGTTRARGSTPRERLNRQPDSPAAEFGATIKDPGSVYPSDIEGYARTHGLTIPEAERIIMDGEDHDEVVAGRVVLGTVYAPLPRELAMASHPEEARRLAARKAAAEDAAKTDEERRLEMGVREYPGPTGVVTEAEDLRGDDLPEVRQVREIEAMDLPDSDRDEEYPRTVPGEEKGE